MDPNADKKRMLRFAWCFFCLSLTLLAVAITWRTYTIREIEASRAAADAKDRMIVSMPAVPEHYAPADDQSLQPRPRAFVKPEPEITQTDIVDKQVEWMRQQADAAAADTEFPPRSLAPSEKGIRETQEKGLLLE